MNVVPQVREVNRLDWNNPVAFHQRLLPIHQISLVLSI